MRDTHPHNARETIMSTIDEETRGEDAAGTLDSTDADGGAAEGDDDEGETETATSDDTEDEEESGGAE
jgi:hypothetical protein